MANEVEETRRIAKELRLLYGGTSWLGPSIQDLIDDLDEERARARPIRESHLIWELVLHMAAWLKIARERLSATSDRDASDEENWPATEGSWEEAKAALANEVTAPDRRSSTFRTNGWKNARRRAKCRRFIFCCTVSCSTRRITADKSHY